MVTSWRQLWGQDFPFGFVELAGYDTDTLPGEAMSTRVVAGLRQQQQLAAIQEGVFFAVAMDLSDRAVMADLNITTDVHSRFKEQVGERLSLGGRAVAFGEKTVPWRGPVATEATMVPNSASSVHVRFDVAGSTGGLVLLRPDLFELGFKNGSQPHYFRNATAVLVAKDALLVQLVGKDLDRFAHAGEVTSVRYAQYNEPCNPSNDKARMSPGGGGEPGPATTGNQTATLSCSLYAKYAVRGAGQVTLPARAFTFNVHLQR